MNCFNDRLSQLENRIVSTERIISIIPQPRSHKSPIRSTSDPTELDIIKNRLLLLEQRIDQKRPAISFPNPSIDDLWDRIDEVEQNCSRLTDDSFAAIEAIHAQMNSIQSQIPDSHQIESRISSKLNDGIEKIAMVLRKIVAIQKSLSTKPNLEKENALESLHRELEYIRYSTK